MRPTAERSVIEALPTALATSPGRSATRISSAGTSAATSTSRTAPWASASTKTACGNVTLRSSGLRW
jgi:hypothetical protein